MVRLFIHLNNSLSDKNKPSIFIKKDFLIICECLISKLFLIKTIELHLDD